jgi:hypothetical protein
VTTVILVLELVQTVFVVAVVAGAARLLLRARRVMRPGERA